MDDKPKAVLFMIMAACGFAGMGAFVKLASEVPVYDKVFFRNLISLGIAAAFAIKARRPLLGKLKSQPYLLGRSLLGLIGVILYFYALSNLILADAVLLNNISPFFTTLFAFLFLREKLSRVQMFSLLVAFTGAMLIIKPSFDYSMLPVAAGFCSAMFAGGAYTVVRYLRKRERPETIVFYFSLVSVIGILPLTATTFSWPGATQALWLLGIGIGGACGQFGLTLAYRYAPASEVAIYTYLTVVFATVLGYFVWGELPDILSITGGLMIFGAALYVFLFRKSKNAQKAVG